MTGNEARQESGGVDGARTEVTVGCQCWRRKMVIQVTCDVDVRVSHNVQEKVMGWEQDRGVGLGMRFRVGGTKEWPS